MLNNITVYNRKTSEEVNLEMVRIGFGENLWLFVGADSSFEEMKFELKRTDPLAKFKRATKGLWFCEEYVVAEDQAVVKCEYYNYIEEEYKIEDSKSKNKMEIDIRDSKIEFYNISGIISRITKYLNPSCWELPSLRINAGEFSIDELSNLQTQIDLFKADVTTRVRKKENLNYIAFQKLTQDLGMNIKHGMEYKFSYKSIGEDKYIKLLEIINSNICYNY